MQSFNCMILRLAAFASGVIVSGQSQGSLVFVGEIEPNNSLLTAQALPTIDDKGVVHEATVAPGDVDFFAVTFTANVSIIAGVESPGLPFPVNFEAVLDFFNQNGTLLAYSDDAFQQLPGLFLLNVGPGTYYFAVSGGGDAGFIGDHNETFTYDLRIFTGTVPAPSAASLLGVARLAGRTRRRSG